MRRQVRARCLCERGVNGPASSCVAAVLPLWRRRSGRPWHGQHDGRPARRRGQDVRSSALRYAYADPAGRGVRLVGPPRVPEEEFAGRPVSAGLVVMPTGCHERRRGAHRRSERSKPPRADFGWQRQSCASAVIVRRSRYECRHRSGVVVAGPDQAGVTEEPAVDAHLEHCPGRGRPDGDAPAVVSEQRGGVVLTAGEAHDAAALNDRRERGRRLGAVASRRRTGGLVSGRVLRYA